ncbi:MAG TPA: 4-hydroxy-tetrahydrodipicolinate reductase [Thermoanaerobaculia bacterium]
MTKKLRVCLAGATGWVGCGLAPAIAAAEDLELVGAVSRSHAGRPLGEVLGDPDLTTTIQGTVAEALRTPCDVLVDYTSPEAVESHVRAAIAAGAHVVIGSSGVTEEQFASIDQAARAKPVGVIAVGNFAITAVLLQRFAEIAAKHLPAWEIIEYGHSRKPDAPSGTARQLANRLAAIRRPETEVAVEKTHGLPQARGASFQGSQIHSVRLPGFVSSMEILFGLPDERLSIRHDSGSGAGPYIAGTLLAIRKVASFIGLRRGLDSLMDL